MWDLYAENYRTLMKEIKQDTHKWRDIPRPRIERFKIEKMSVLTKLTCRFNAIPIKIPARFFVAIDKIILQYIYGKVKELE